MSVETDGKLEGWSTGASSHPDRTVFPVAMLIAVSSAETANEMAHRGQSGRTTMGKWADVGGESRDFDLVEKPRFCGLLARSGGHR